MDERRTDPRDKALARDRRRRISCPTRGRNRIGSHGREPARLVHQPPARLGRADRRVRRQGAPASRCATRRSIAASSRPSRRRAPTPGISSPPQHASSGNDRDPDDYEQVDGHRRRLVREPARPTPSCWSARHGLPWPADLYLEGSDQHRGWFQSSLLESCRHPRPRAVQGGPDPWLRDRRAGPQDVEVAGQRHRAAGGDEASTAPISCGSG